MGRWGVKIAAISVLVRGCLGRECRLIFPSVRGSWNECCDHVCDVTVLELVREEAVPMVVLMSRSGLAFMCPCNVLVGLVERGCGDQWMAGHRVGLWVRWVCLRRGKLSLWPWLGSWSVDR